jgi:hypothetical protein
MPDSEDIRAYVLEKLTELAVIAQSFALTILAEKIREAAGVETPDAHEDKPPKTREAS